MLIGTPTKFGAGMLLCGDYWDLHSLYETIHKIVEQASLSLELEEFVLGLAYEVRKAFEKNREEETFGHDGYDMVTYRGVKLIWPTLLFRAGMLRSAAGFGIMAKEDQANLFRFEHCIESALTMLNPKVAAQCIPWLPYLGPRTSDYLVSYPDEVDYKFLFESGAGRHRIAKLPAILTSMTEGSAEYTQYREEILAEASKRGCTAQDLHVTRMWPKIRW